MTKPIAYATLGYYSEPGTAGPSTEPPPPAFGGADIPDANTLSRVIILEVGAQVTYQWSTVIHKTLSGLEQRECTLNAPKQRYEGSAYMFTGDTRDVRANLVKNAAAGVPFLLALPYEEITAADDGTFGSSHTTIPVSDTSELDWAVATQQVVIIAPDGTAAYTSIVSFTSNTIVVNGNHTDVALAGARIVPLVAILIDPQQAFVRWPVTAEQWQIRAANAGFGFAGTLTMGVGATINTFVSRPIWDRGIVANDTVSDSIQTLAEVIDFGAVPVGVGAADTPDWGRRIVFASSSHDDWQWLKAFLYTIRGANRAFWLPSYRPDFDVVSQSGDTFTVNDSSHEGAGDPLAWYPDLRDRVEITMDDGSIQRLQITSVHDNLDGTLTFQVSDTISGTIEMVSWIDLCRLENDTVTVTWNANGFTIGIDARAVRQ